MAKKKMLTELSDEQLIELTSTQCGECGTLLAATDDPAETHVVQSNAAPTQTSAIRKKIEAGIAY